MSVRFRQEPRLVSEEYHNINVLRCIGKAIEREYQQKQLPLFTLKKKGKETS